MSNNKKKYRVSNGLFMFGCFEVIFLIVAAFLVLSMAANLLANILDDIL